MNSRKMNIKENKITQVFDVFFIMILCFITLLTTMLMQGKVLVGSGDSGGSFTYRIDLNTLLPLCILLSSYLIFICFLSNKELRKMIKNLYASSKE